MSNAHEQVLGKIVKGDTVYSFDFAAIRWALAEIARLREELATLHKGYADSIEARTR